MTTSPDTMETRRAGDRFHTRIGWLDSSHCFSLRARWRRGDAVRCSGRAARRGPNPSGR